MDARGSSLRRRYVWLQARPTLPREGRAADEGYGASADPDWRTVDWRSHLRDAEIGGRRMHYVDIGEGDEEPVLLVHGLSGCWQNWLETIPALARTRRVIAPDLPGFGRSEMPAAKISITGYARALDELCTNLGIGAAAVIGNSMGGFVGAEMAIRTPARVERLVLVAAAGISIRDLRRAPLLGGAKVLAWMSANAAAGQPQVIRRPGVRHLIFAAAFRHPTRLAADLLHEQLNNPSPPGFVDALDALTSYDFVDRLPEIGCPTLVVWGANDALVPTRDAFEYEALIPDARAVILEDTGHVPQIERPRAFNDLAAAFLDERGGASRQPGVAGASANGAAPEGAADGADAPGSAADGDAPEAAADGDSPEAAADGDSVRDGAL